MKRALLFSILTLMVAGTAFAGTQDDAVVALQSQIHQTKAILICGSANPNDNSIPCSNYTTDQEPIFNSRDVYLCVARANATDGIAGVSCGIATDPLIGVFAWTLCADLDFPNGGWPGNGGGDRITWAAATNCQNTVIGGDGVHAVAGAFYVYAYGDGTMSVTPNNGLVIPEFRVADCNASESDVSVPGGAVGFGTVDGFNPCDPVPVERTTWGAIKGNLD